MPAVLLAIAVQETGMAMQQRRAPGVAPHGDGAADKGDVAVQDHRLAVVIRTLGLVGDDHPVIAQVCGTATQDAPHGAAVTSTFKRLEHACRDVARQGQDDAQLFAARYFQVQQSRCQGRPLVNKRAYSGTLSEMRRHQATSWRSSSNARICFLTILP
ncbi:hypothetical protein D3C81_1339050 [compost metagenome]